MAETMHPHNKPAQRTYIRMMFLAEKNRCSAIGRKRAANKAGAREKRETDDRELTI
jgi:hypothetical protein